jgi:hypothetical protein
VVLQATGSGEASARSAAAPVSGTGSRRTPWRPQTRTSGRAPPAASQSYTPVAVASSLLVPGAAMVAARIEDFQPLDDRQAAVHAQPLALEDGGELPAVDQPPVDRGLPAYRVEPGAIEKGTMQGMAGERLVECRKAPKPALIHFWCRG